MQKQQIEEDTIKDDKKGKEDAYKKEIKKNIDINEDKLKKLIKNKISSHILQERQDNVTNSNEIINSIIQNFKNALIKQLVGMGIDKYIDKAKAGLKEDDFIQQISTDYRKNVNRNLNFKLIVQRDEDGKPEKISLEADKFIDSVDLDKVVARVNNQGKKNDAQIDKIDLNKYSLVAEMDAISAMNKLKDVRASLTPEVSRWFGAVQRIIGKPKEGELFRSYLQRAMSMKSEIDSNLNHPDKENIENALQEIVPILYKNINETKQNKKNAVNDILSSEISDNHGNDSIEEKDLLGAGERIASQIEQETSGRIDMNDYYTVSTLDASKAMKVLQRIAEYTGKTEMANFIKQLMRIDAYNIEGKTFGDYIDTALEKLHLLRTNIQKELEELDDNFDLQNMPIKDIFKVLVEKKKNLKYVTKESMAQLFRMGGVAAPVKDETLDAYFIRLEKDTKSNFYHFLRYAIPNLRKSMVNGIIKR